MESQSHCKSLSSDLAKISDSSYPYAVSKPVFKDCSGFCWVKGHMSLSQGWHYAASQHRAPGGPTY